MKITLIRVALPV